MIPPMLSRFGIGAAVAEPQPQPSTSAVVPPRKPDVPPVATEPAPARPHRRRRRRRWHRPPTRTRTPKLKESVDQARQRAERERARAVRAKAADCHVSGRRRGDGTRDGARHRRTVRGLGPRLQQRHARCSVRSIDDVESALASRDPGGAIAGARRPDDTTQHRPGILRRRPIRTPRRPQARRQADGGAGSRGNAAPHRSIRSRGPGVKTEPPQVRRRSGATDD